MSSKNPENNKPDEREERTLPANASTFQGQQDEDTGTNPVLRLPVLSTTSDGDDAPAASGPAAAGQESGPRGEEPGPAGEESGPAGEEPGPAGKKPDAAEPRPSRGGAARRPSRTATALRFLVKATLWVVAFPFLCILPFIAALRISVLSYQENTLAGWEALGLGMLAAVVLVCLYITAFMLTFRIPKRFFMGFLNVGLAAMLCYTGFALFHLATTQAKTEETRSYYTSLHPFLRVAIKNIAVIDDDLIITDVHRTRAEYAEMGLQPREYSLHFRQSTGFVHAVDIRTIGRSKLTNLMVELYFALMGFETIRHVGTADHLHVALPLGETGQSESGGESD